jgi:hypothetical protein
MTYYRLYYFDVNDKIRHMVELECESDAQVIETIEQHRVHFPHASFMEIWNLDRKVGTFK